MLLSATGMCGCRTAQTVPTDQLTPRSLAGICSVAILPFGDAPGADAGRSGQVVAGCLAAALRQHTPWRIVERQHIADIKAELAFQQSAFADPNEAVRIGKLLGVQAVIVGNVSQYEIGSIPFLFFLVFDKNIYRVGFGFRMIRVETGEVCWTENATATSWSSFESSVAQSLAGVFERAAIEKTVLVAQDNVAQDNKMTVFNPTTKYVAGMGTGLALLVGINDYEIMGKLENCRQDATEIRDILLRHGGYSANRVILLTDGGENDTRTTFTSVTRRIEQTCKLARPEDVLLIYFAGHGITVDGESYLVPEDGSEPRTCIPMAWVQEQMHGAMARSKILIVDACHSGKTVRGTTGIVPSMREASNYVMISSCAQSEFSYPEGKHGAFTQCLLDGLSGSADSNDDGHITSGELYRFVQRGMEGWCLRTGKTQRPQLLPCNAQDIDVSVIKHENALNHQQQSTTVK